MFFQWVIIIIHYFEELYEMLPVETHSFVYQNSKKSICESIWASKGRYIKYAGGVRRVFVGVMKYFRHILMGNEIFFKIFDGLRNIFLCSTFIILFFKLKG